MSYVVLALKWRPKGFSELVGQDHIVETLQNAITKNRLAHAYLFSGPRGVGKTSTARILAKAINCKEAPTDNPCGKCSSCLEISQGRSLDVIEIDGASNRGIDEIRTLRENVRFSPVQGKYKIYIIDEVHQITSDGFNALLKTLEEPPEFVKFIFATTSPNKVPATILSRCHRLDFRRITIVEIISLLEKIVKNENVSVDKDVLLAIARASDGGLRDAESILDQLIAFAKEKISIQDVTSMLGLVDQSALFEITDKLINKEPKNALEIFNRIINQGKDVNTFLTNLVEHFRNIMIAKVSKADIELMDLPQDVCDRLLKQSENVSLDYIFSAFNILSNAQDMTKRFDSVRIPLEIALVRLAQDKTNSIHVTSHSVVNNSVVNPKVQTVSTVSVKPVEPQIDDIKPSVNIVNTEVSIDLFKSQWNHIISLVKTSKMLLGTYLNESEPIEFSNNILKVSFPKNCSLHKEMLERKDNKELVEKNIKQILNCDIQLSFMLSAEEKHTDVVNTNPAIKSALRMFNAKVIKEG